MRVWCHALRHSAITTAIERRQQAGIGLDQIRTFSRHRTLATMLVYRDQHDALTVHRTLAEVVAATLTSPQTERSSPIEPPLKPGSSYRVMVHTCRLLATVKTVAEAREIVLTKAGVSKFPSPPDRNVKDLPPLE